MKESNILIEMNYLSFISVVNPFFSLYSSYIILSSVVFNEEGTLMALK